MATHPDIDMSCIGCGYRLRGLNSCVCPECGRWFDPLISKSYRDRMAGFRWRRLLSVPSLFECWAVIVFTLLILIGVSGAARWKASGVLIAGCVGIPFVICLVVVYIQRVVYCVRDVALAEPTPTLKRQFPRFLVILVSFLLIGSAMMTQWPTKLRFSLSRSAFENAVAERAAKTFRNGQWVGLYYVSDSFVEMSGGVSRVSFVTGNSLYGKVGFQFDERRNRNSNACVASGWHTFEK